MRGAGRSSLGEVFVAAVAGDAQVVRPKFDAREYRGRDRSLQRKIARKSGASVGNSCVGNVTRKGFGNHYYLKI
jgi:hypothetical protein